MLCAVQQLGHSLDMLLSNIEAKDIEISVDTNPMRMQDVLDESKVVLDHRETVIQFKDRGVFRPWHRNQKTLLTLYCMCAPEQR